MRYDQVSVFRVLLKSFPVLFCSFPTCVLCFVSLPLLVCFLLCLINGSGEFKCLCLFDLLVRLPLIPASLCHPSLLLSSVLEFSPELLKFILSAPPVFVQLVLLTLAFCFLHLFKHVKLETDKLKMRPGCSFMSKENFSE